LLIVAAAPVPNSCTVTGG
jgi:hypothetical protein